MLAALSHMGEREVEGEGEREQNRGVLGAMKTCFKLIFDPESSQSERKHDLMFPAPRP